MVLRGLEKEHVHNGNIGQTKDIVYSFLSGASTAVGSVEQSLKI